MKKIGIVIPIMIMVLLSSGCVVPGTGIEIPGLPNIFGGTQVNEQRHDVISIESLQAIPATELRERQDVRIRAVIKNLQAPEYKPTENVSIVLFNDCGIFKTEISFCQTGDEIKDEKNGVYGCKFDRMHPQSTQIVEWKLNAKDVNVETSCKIGVMAQYYYTTYSTSSVTFINKIEVERLVSEGKSFSETGIASIGEGPVKSYIEVNGQPIIIDPSKDSKEAGSGIMTFWISNRGNGLLDFSKKQIEKDDETTEGGNVFFPEEGDKDCGDRKYDYRPQMCIHIESKLRWISLESEDKKENVEEKTLEDCIKYHLGKIEKEGEPINKFDLNFIQKSTPKYSCSVIVPDSSLIKQEKTYQIESQIGYNYKFVKEITVTVKPNVKV
ncbi:MAG: hypothetical protein KAS32_03500 [Candidatus Peribacteraceae bacterium]|nr:hypothetical protein [Candidatus Peribacteraceae bacterium]